MLRLVVIGSGIGGKLISFLVNNSNLDIDLTLIGPESKEPSGLFYLNKKIPGVAEEEITVTYNKIGNGTEKDYQIKSRGYYSDDLKISSFKKVGTQEIGYKIDENKLASVCNSRSYKYRRYLNNVTSVNLENRSVLLDNGLRVDYDMLISTVNVNIFCMLAGIILPTIIRSSPVHTFELYGFKAGYTNKDYKKIDVFYDTTEEGSFYRISSYCDEEGSVLKIVSETILNIKDRTRTLFPGKIIPSEKITSFVNNFELNHPEVKLLGRYARWDYHYTVDQTYFDAKEFINERINKSGD